MWNLSGDDIQRAKEELNGRRAAIKARYDQELKQLESDLAELEAFERAAVNIVSHLKGEEAAAAPVAEPAPAAAEPVAAETASVSDSAPVTEAPAERGAEPQTPEARPAAGERGSSRWRMRLGTTEGSH